MMLRLASSVRGLGGLLLAAALASCGGRSPRTARRQRPRRAPRDATASESARLNTWLDARFEEELRFSPLFETILGRKTDYDKIDDVSEAADDAQLAWRRSDGRRAAAHVRLRAAHARGEDVLRPLGLRARARREGEAVPPPLLRVHSDGRPADEPARGADQLPSRRRRGRHARVRRAHRRRRARDRPVRRAREARCGRGRARAALRGRLRARAGARARHAARRSTAPATRRSGPTRKRRSTRS